MNAQTLALALRLKSAVNAPRTAQEQREDALIVQASEDAPYLAPGVARRLLWMYVK